MTSRILTIVFTVMASACPTPEPDPWAKYCPSVADEAYVLCGSGSVILLDHIRGHLVSAKALAEKTKLSESDASTAQRSCSLASGLFQQLASTCAIGSSGLFTDPFPPCSQIGKANRAAARELGAYIERFDKAEAEFRNNLENAQNNWVGRGKGCPPDAPDAK